MNRKIKYICMIKQNKLLKHLLARFIAIKFDCCYRSRRLQFLLIDILLLSKMGKILIEYDYKRLYIIMKISTS
jgi:hypothetical protein